MTKKSSPPKYRHQKSRNLAVVRIHGKDHYLGEYNSPESKQLYARLIAEMWADFPEADTARLPNSLKAWPTIDELIARFMTTYVSQTHVNKHGKPTDRYYHLKAALRPLHKLYGNTPVNEFGSKRLKMVREQIIKDGIDEKGGFLRADGGFQILQMGEHQFADQRGRRGDCDGRSERSGSADTSDFGDEPVIAFPRFRRIGFAEIFPSVVPPDEGPVGGLVDLVFREFLNKRGARPLGPRSFRLLPLLIAFDL